MTETNAASISDFRFLSLLRRAWDIVIHHWFVLLIAGFVRDLVALLSGCLAFSATLDCRGWNLILGAIVACVVWFSLHAGYIKFCLTICRTDKARWQDLFSCISLGPYLLLATALVWSSILLGLLLLLIPGLILYVRLCLFDFALIDQKLTA